MLHDQGAHFYPVEMIAPNDALAADNTPVEVDLQGYGAATIILAVGVGGITFSGTNKIEAKLTHGNTSGALTAVARKDVEGIAAADLTDDEISSGIIKSFIAEHAAAAIYVFRYVGGKRFIELLADFSGTHGTGTPIYACCIRGRPNVSQLTV